MNPNFTTIIQAGVEDRRDLFMTSAARLGTTVQYVEKDFWVCWTLDALFSGLPEGSPRLLFKGGTSLSKAYGLISRFSEDIDISVFRQDIGQDISSNDLQALSRKKQRQRLQDIVSACQAYICGPLADNLHALASAVMPADAFRIEPDPEDTDQQTLLFWYPAIFRGNDADEYVRAAVKIEAGARSALDPHEATTVRPYVADDLPDLPLDVPGVTTIAPERTFWDKIIIVHGQRQVFDADGHLNRRGQRVSRHYYDIYRLLQHPNAKDWMRNRELAQDCANHARAFFFRRKLNLETAAHGSFTLAPTEAMRADLKKDYDAMAGMIFGPKPDIDDVFDAISALEAELNA